MNIRIGNDITLNITLDDSVTGGKTISHAICYLFKKDKKEDVSSPTSCISTDYTVRGCEPMGYNALPSNVRYHGLSVCKNGHECFDAFEFKADATIVSNTNVKFTYPASEQKHPGTYKLVMDLLLINNNSIKSVIAKSDDVFTLSIADYDVDEDQIIDITNSNAHLCLDEAPANGKQYVRKNKTWEEVDFDSVESEIEELDDKIEQLKKTNISKVWLGTLVNGTVSTSTSKITSASNSVVMKSVSAVPYIGVTMRFKLPSNIKANVYYNHLTNVSGSDSKLNYNISADIRNGGKYQAVENHITGFDAQWYRIKFTCLDGNITVELIQNLIDNEEIMVTYENNDLSTIQRNYDVESILSSAKTYFSASGGEYPRGEVYPVLIHASDFHSDYYRLRNVVEYAKHINPCAMLLTGDFVGVSVYDDIQFVLDAVDDCDIPVISCIGNHETYGGTNSWLYNSFFLELDDKYEYNQLNSNCYGYKDLASQKLRVIFLNQWGSTTGAWTKANMGQALYKYLADTLATTPAGYGVIIAIHTMGTPVAEIDDTFNCPEIIQNDQSIGETVTGVKMIVDEFIKGTNGEGTSGTLTVPDIINKSQSTTVSVAYDFTSTNHPNLSTAEFICYCSGHMHTDRIGYLPGTTDEGENKQVLLGISTDNATSNYTNDLGKNKGKGKALDVINVYVIDRPNKEIRIVRIGANVSYLMKDRKYMSIKYKD